MVEEQFENSYLEDWRRWKGNIKDKKWAKLALDDVQLLTTLWVLLQSIC
jgi:hypothetical protein